MDAKPPDTSSEEAAHLVALNRHFADLRDGAHGAQTERADKESLFRVAVGLLDAQARRAFNEVDAALLQNTGTISVTGVVTSPDGGLYADWVLAWPEQRQANLEPVRIRAHYGARFHHPHLRGATVGEWPLNIFSEQDAAAQLPVLRAIVTADLHNLVYQRDFRIVPATTLRARRS